MPNELKIFDDLQMWGSGWKMELAVFVIQAERDNKLIMSPYQQLFFTPRELAKRMLKDQFVWGVVNWRLVDRTDEYLAYAKEMETPDA